MPVLAGDLQAGVKGGVNLSNTRIDEDGAADTNSRTGMSIGAFVGVPVNEMFSHSARGPLLDEGLQG